MHSIYCTRIEYSSETCCHSCFSRFLPPGCTATSLSAPLSWYFPPHLTPPLSSLMTVNKADRLIYLHWWQGRKKSSAKPCPAPGLWQAGLGGNPGRLATPRAGHISLCCPWPCSDLTARWDQSFLRPTDSQTHSHISYRGESERRRESSRQSGRLLLVVCTLAERKTRKPVFVLFWVFFLLCHFSSRSVDEPGRVSSGSRLSVGFRGRSQSVTASWVCVAILQLLNTGTVL